MVYEGIQIHSLVQPAIVAFGNEEGDNYSQPARVWLRARVLVEDSAAEKQKAVKAPGARRTETTRQFGPPEPKVEGYKQISFVFIYFSKYMSPAQV